MDGFISLHRKILDWRYIDDPVMFSLWIQLLLRANHAPNIWKNIPVERGQLVTTVEKLSGYIGAKSSTIRCKLKELANGGEIEIKTTNKFTIVSVCNYDNYQSPNDTTLQTKPQTKLQTNCKQTATNNKDNKDNNIYIKINSNELTKNGSDEPNQTPASAKLKPKKESAIVYNTRLYNQALADIKAAMDAESTPDSYSRFIVWMNEEHSTILYTLRLMSRRSYETMRTKYDNAKIKEIVDNIENRIDFVKKQGYSELGRTMNNWLKRE